MFFTLFDLNVNDKVCLTYTSIKFNFLFTKYCGTKNFEGQDIVLTHFVSQGLYLSDPVWYTEHNIQRL